MHIRCVKWFLISYFWHSILIKFFIQWIGRINFNRVIVKTVGLFVTTNVFWSHSLDVALLGSTFIELNGTSFILSPLRTGDKFLPFMDFWSSNFDKTASFDSPFNPLGGTTLTRCLLKGKSFLKAGFDRLISLWVVILKNV